jgi:mitogen-activated protein kinase kinase kinase 3
VLTSKDVNGYSFNIDVWSLGMTVIEMLTAEMPFSDFSNPFAVMFQIARIKEMPVPEYLSSEATEFIRKCLRVDPVERPNAKVGTRPQNPKPSTRNSKP